METAKVDLRKLQLLNDRIAQVIEALNQVRFSVHGLQHTPGFSPGLGWAGMPTYGTQAYGTQTYGAQPFGVSPFGSPQQFVGAMNGTPINPGIGLGIGIPQTPMSAQVAGLNGLSHTGAEIPGIIDPIVAQQLAARWAQPVAVPGAYPYGHAVQFAQTFPWAYVPAV